MHASKLFHQLLVSIVLHHAGGKRPERFHVTFDNALDAVFRVGLVAGGDGWGVVGRWLARGLLLTTLYLVLNDFFLDD